MPNIDNIILLLILIMQAFNLWCARRTEKNTNSMKDALVKATGEAAHAAGRQEAQDEAYKNQPNKNG